MRRNVFAICDAEAGYLGLLADYAGRRGNLPFELHAFTSQDAVLEFAKEHPIELLLIAGKAYSDRIKDAGIGKIVLLMEEETRERQAGLPCVYKYQSCANILQQTMAAYGEGQPTAVGYGLAKSSRVYGVYSPAGGCGCTSLALALGMELARRKPTLFLSFEGISGLSKMLSLPEGHSMSDLLYYARQRDGSLAMRSAGMVTAVQGMDIIPPVRIPEDVHQARGEDFEFLVRELRTHSAYEAFVLDVGREASDQYSILLQCDQIFMPQRGDPLSMAKMATWRDYAREVGAEDILSRMELVTLPVPRENPPGKELASYLLWGEMGELARCLLREPSQAGTG